MLLKVPLGKVLKLSLWELGFRWSRNSKLGAVTANSYSIVSKVGCFSINLDAVLEVLLERGNIKYLIINWCSTVDNKLYGSLLCLNLKNIGERMCVNLCLSSKSKESRLRHWCECFHSVDDAQR